VNQKKTKDTRLLSVTSPNANRFLPRDAMLARYAVVVCLDVSLSDTLRSIPECVRQRDIKTAKRRITQIMPHDSPVTSFMTPKFTVKFERNYPLRGRQMQMGWVKVGLFRRKTHYNPKTVQDRRIVSIKVE